jgi:hypothetical protein
VGRADNDVPRAEVGGTQIYAAVLDDGVRTPEQFAQWLATH